MSPPRRRAVPFLVAAVALGVASAALAPFACLPQRPRAVAKRVEARHELIGGPRALGEVGDWLLENDQARFIVQDDGFSRGFGVFGGSLVDADLVRETTGAGDATGGVGKDAFGEMFPAFFVEAVEPLEVRDPDDRAGERRLPPIEVEKDGEDGEAVLVVRGYGNDFLAITQYANEVLLSDDRALPRILFETRYSLKPGARWLEITTTIQNVDVADRPLEWNGAEQVLGVELPTPLGDVVLFGAGNSVFVPHEAGYDVRYRLEREYKSDRYVLPAFPGLVADFVATSGPGVSYGIVGAPNPEHAYAWGLKESYPGVQPWSVHVPFIASAFTGVYVAVPPVLQPNDFAPGGPDEFSYKRYFVVGDGDVASIAEAAYGILGVKTGAIVGRVVEDGARAGLPGADVIAIDVASGRKMVQARSDVGGRFDARLPPGRYDLIAVVEGRRPSRPVRVDVAADGAARADVVVDAPARAIVTVSERSVGRVPARVVLVGTAPAERAGQDTRDWLFDLSLGESWRTTDLVADDPDDPSTRRYIEASAYAADGVVRLTAPPGDYVLYATRGPEYDVFSAPITLTAGVDRAVAATLQRVVSTPGYVAADFHLHSIASLDSFAPLDARIAAYAAEGLEYAVSTDHNFVVDYAPVIASLGLQSYVGSAVGLELSTIDRGHYNGFPLRMEETTLVLDEDGAYQDTIGSRTYGSFNWVGVTPQAMFDGLRALGERSPSGDVVPALVQVNHPRGAIGGYFAVYGYDKATLRAEGKTGLFAPKIETHPEFSPEYFSYDFDAIEIVNGTRNEFLHDFRVPDDFAGDVDPISCCPIAPGEVLYEHEPLDCDPAARDCTCTAADTAAQIADGACVRERPAIPGVVEDWLSLLAAGVRTVGTANSDSHSDHGAAPGTPRTYVRVPIDAPGVVTSTQIADGLRAGDALMTNGPFVLVSIDGGGPGAIVDAADEVELVVEVRTAPWVQVDRLRVWVGEEVVATRAIAIVDGVGVERFSIAAARDSFVIVEATGSRSMFPIVPPNDELPVLLEDALKAVGGSFGLSGNSAALQPPMTGVVTALAITNPIWLDVDGDSVIAPSRTLPQARAAPVSAATPGPTLPEHAIAPRRTFPIPDLRRVRAADRIALSRLPWWLWPTDDVRDVRRVMWNSLRHPHAE